MGCRYVGFVTEYPEIGMHMDSDITEDTTAINEDTSKQSEEDRTEYDVKVFERMMTERIRFIPTPPVMVLFY